MVLEVDTGLPDGLSFGIRIDSVISSGVSIVSLLFVGSSSISLARKSGRSRRLCGVRNDLLGMVTSFTRPHI